MKTAIKHHIFLCAIVLLSSCDLLEPGEIENPNVSEKTFLTETNIMETWLNGVEKSFALAIGKYCLHTEIISDNYYNNYTRENKVFDIPQLLNTDPDIEELQRYVGTLREAADYGLNTVQKHDKTTTKAQLFRLQCIKAYSFLLAGENFMALPVTTGGKPIVWREQLRMALTTLDDAMKETASNTDKAFIHTLKARAYYRLGEADAAMEESKKALDESSDMIIQVMFDGENGVTNAIQDDIYKTMYQPLPRLDFLDPKYFQLKSTDERPICIAKAEENYLIIAEALLAKGHFDESRKTLKELLRLVSERPIEHKLNDWLEGRFNGGFKHYPDNSQYLVAASADDEYRAGLVLDRQQPNLIDIPYISGTSVTAGMIDGCTNQDQLLATIYLMRQEIFIAEGRRMNDLGIRLPICKVEAGHINAPTTYTQAFIPAFIPLEQGMDAFDMDTENKKVTIKYNMNKIIVANKNDEAVAPFFH